MSRRKKARGRKKRNPGWFKRGHDARRSTYRFTAQDCRVGYLVAAILHPELVEWLRMKIRCHYHRKEQGNGHAPQEEGGQRSAASGERNGISYPGPSRDYCESDIPF